MSKCKECGSYAINLNRDGRDESDADLCDVCYWRRRATQAEEVVNRLPKTSDGVPIVPGMAVWFQRSRNHGWQAIAELVGGYHDWHGEWTCIDFDKKRCFSTREAAEKARKP